MKTLKLFIVASFLFVFGKAYSQDLPKAVLTVCENTDDNVNPVNPKTTVKVGEKIVYQISFDKPYKLKDETEPQQFFIAWEVYRMDDEGKDVEHISELSMTTGSLFRRYGIEEFQTFPKPGKYRVYALPWDMRDINVKSGNYKNYFGAAEIEVTE
ncbi:MAG: hypothetical protein SGI89_14685 [bacterium]|nr:hypothetical protein [bacterium]